MPSEHSLRPALTQELFKRLTQGAAINLIAAPEQGSKRLLEDLSVNLPPEMLVLKVDVASYKNNYPALLEALWQQLPTPRGKQPENLAQLVTLLEKRSEKRIILCLQHYDALFNNPKLDVRYDQSFFNHLNSLRNQPRIGLLCVTRQPHDLSVVFIAGQAQGNSWLDLEKRLLPKLTSEQVRDEIKREVPGLTDVQAQICGAKISECRKPYDFLSYCVTQLNAQADVHLPLDKRLERWEQQFNSLEKIGTANFFREFRTLKAWILVLVQGVVSTVSTVFPLWRLVRKWFKHDEF